MSAVTPWTPLTLNSGAILSNRFVLAPMTTDSSHPDGTVSEQELDYIRRRSATGLAAGITSCAYVEEDGRAWQGIGASEDHHHDSLRAVAKAFQQGGAGAILQLYDGGRIASPDIVAPPNLRAPSAIPSLRPGAHTPRALDSSEIAGLLGAFGCAAERAWVAGFDGVELHGANHYLLHQFLSPRANQRDDEWGGSLENRMRFPLAVTAAVRDALGPGVTLGYRINPFESEPGGFTLDDSITLCDRLADEGVDYVHVSMDDFRRNSPQPEDRDWTKAPAKGLDENPVRAIANAVGGRCAVVASGGIRVLSDAEEALAAGADLVAVGRAILVDPDWLAKLANPGAGTIRSAMPTTRSQLESALTIPSRMADYLLSRPGWIPQEQSPTRSSSASEHAPSVGQRAGATTHSKG
jgi:2,4-dienoyl-CoA reductase-like NADH-dependent reductase (Old Yellow Enzyme family)